MPGTGSSPAPKRHAFQYETRRLPTCGRYRGALKASFNGEPFGLVDGKFNVLVYGWYGAGKSAFINSSKIVVHPSNAGEALPYVQPVQTGEEQCTTELIPVEFGGDVPLLLWDTMGSSMDSYSGNELEAIFQGRLPPGWRIQDPMNTQMLSPPATIQEEVERFNRTPHACIFAMHYEMLDDTDGEAMQKLKAEFKKIIKLGVMPIVIVTQIDRQEEVEDPRHAKIREDPRAAHAFKDEKLRQAASFFGIPNGQVYACVNYLDMDSKSWALDRHLWLILHRALSSAKQRCEHQKQLAQTRARLSGRGAAGGSPMLDRLANLQQEVEDERARREESERTVADAIARGDSLAEQLDASQQRLGEALSQNTELERSKAQVKEALVHEQAQVTALDGRLRRTEAERDRATEAARTEAERRATAERAREAALAAAQRERAQKEEANAALAQAARDMRRLEGEKAALEAAAADAALAKAQADERARASEETAAERWQSAGQAAARSAAEAAAARAAAATASKKGRTILGLATLAVLCSGPLWRLLLTAEDPTGPCQRCEQLMLPPGMGGDGAMGGFGDTNDSGIGWDVANDAAGASPPPRPPLPSFHVASQQPWPPPSPAVGAGMSVLYGTTVALFLTAVYFLKPAHPRAAAAVEQPQEAVAAPPASPPASPPAPASPSSSGEQWAMVDGASPS